jgi:hypothetical protein
MAEEYAAPAVPHGAAMPFALRMLAWLCRFFAATLY